MTWDYIVSSGIDLYVRGRIDEASARRQRATAHEILARLADHPGLVLADEVGMGKTYVALAVGVSIALQNIAQGNGSGPVVVMVPPSVKHKWPQDFSVFRDRCLKREAQARVPLTATTAETGVDFLKLLDDPPERQKHLIFLTHGALSRGLSDPWVKLALIRRVFRRPSLASVRRAFPRFAGKLLRLQSKTSDDVFWDCLEAPPTAWRSILARYGIETDDDPVPHALWHSVEELQGKPFDAIAEVLGSLPQRDSGQLDDRILEARRKISQAFDEVWRTWLAAACKKVRLPLLILDEAHHLKNRATRAASLFSEEVAEDDARAVAGPLNGVFERMLFLTATPFQLGHHELLSVLSVFKNIDWTSPNAPLRPLADFQKEFGELEGALDRAQGAALGLERIWSRLRPEHVVGADGLAQDSDEWWATVAKDGDAADGTVGDALKQAEVTNQAMRASEKVLAPWVIRHVKPTLLAGTSIRRRKVVRGAGILDEDLTGGLEVEGRALLPFLLAACAQATVATTSRGRALFAEGLASSYEAYRETRAAAAERDEDEDVSSDDDSGPAPAPETDWYLDGIERALPRDTSEASAAHPKIRATVARVLDLWKKREKVLVFCHYRATGRALERHISDALEQAMAQIAASRFGLGETEARVRMERIGARLMRTEDPLRQEADRRLEDLVRTTEALSFDELASTPFSDRERPVVVEVMRRFLRTTAFLARFFPEREDQGAIAQAFGELDASGITLDERLRRFCRFLLQCNDGERSAYLGALDDIQTGDRRLRDAHEGDRQSTRLVANVRLVNGATADDTRKRILLAFNTPFFPEILIASSVLAEGVDLHLDCRYVIHHDLSWNPSTLEQRTGRIDRLGAKAERAKAPIHVYLPYVAETQDEKMFRVVQDRERWFQVVMGETFAIDENTTDRQAARVPLPLALAQKLALRLGLDG